MTSRLGNPDTPADVSIRQRLSSNGTRHFIMIAGAGSGKTTSLIKALNHLSQDIGNSLKKQGQQIACITYTDGAVGEISDDVGHDPLFHVSTIHSFLWSIIKPFQSDIHAWVTGRLNEKIAKSEEKIAKPGTHMATKVKERDNINRYRRQIDGLAEVNRFTYGTGSDYLKGVLGHSDILKLGPQLIEGHALMRSIVVQRFPVIFVDESQDTVPAFVSALKVLAANAPANFCLGFFGDPVQKIYMTGIGDIILVDGWEKIEKPENFRCPTTVLNVINAIRAEDDKLHQVRGRMIEVEGELQVVSGTARLFILPGDENRAERLAGVRTWLAEHNNDPNWLDDDDVRMLVIVHRIAAARLGFPNLYSALNDKSPEPLKDGLIDGTAWIVRPFIRYLLPLIQASENNDHFKVMQLLRSNCPLLAIDMLKDQSVAEILARLQDDLARLCVMLQEGSTVPLGDVMTFVGDRQLAEIDERFIPIIADYTAGGDIGENAPENAGHRYLNCQAMELRGYQTYIEEQSPFSTQQVIKGSEFDRVLVVVDDEESTTRTFSYGKYFGYTELSDTDQNHIDAGRDSVVDRTRRLFYVCCSRAVKDLAVVIFAQDVNGVLAAAQAKGFFEQQNTHLL